MGFKNLVINQLFILPLAFLLVAHIATVTIGELSIDDITAY